MKIGQFVPTFYTRPDHGRSATAPLAMHSVASGEAAAERGSGDEAAVRVRISAAAIAALAQANAAASSSAPSYESAPPDAVPESSNSGEVTATVVPDPDVDAAFDSWRATLARGKDLNDIADSLAWSMQEVMDKRPDLAQAEFDFVLEDGRIRVVSDELNARDRTWLESKLNSNTELRTSVRQFHDHTVDAYALARKAYGDPLSAAEYAQANASVDRQFKYMSLLKDVASRIQRDYRAQPEFSFRDQSGASMAFEPEPGNARGVVDFMSRIRSLQSGPLTLVLANGRTDYVRFNDPFGLAGVIIDSYAPKRPV